MSGSGNSAEKLSEHSAHNHKDERGKSSSVESLDRIHTFNLKNAAKKIKLHKDKHS